MLGVPSLHHKHHAIYIDMLGVPSLHHKHHAIYIDMLGVPSLHNEHQAVLFIKICWECLAYTINIMLYYIYRYAGSA